MEWITARIAKRSPSGTQLVALELDHVPADYVNPGQFLQVTVGDLKPAYYALASSPGEPILLLVKNDGPMGSALANVQVGDSVRITPPIGKGFPLAQVDGLDLVILCNGSGISAARPVIRSEIARGLPRKVTFYLGVLSEDRIAFAEELAGWRTAGVDVQVILQLPTPGFRDGFVQGAAAIDGWVRPDVGVVLVGVPQMIEQARALYLSVGANAEHLLVNF